MLMVRVVQVVEVLIICVHFFFSSDSSLSSAHCSSFFRWLKSFDAYLLVVLQVVRVFTRAARSDVFRFLLRVKYFKTMCGLV